MALPGDSATIRAEIGSSQKGPFQDVPLTVRVCEVAGIFGVYFKYYILQEECEPVGQAISMQRSASQVSFLNVASVSE